MKLLREASGGFLLLHLLVLSYFTLMCSPSVLHPISSSEPTRYTHSGTTGFDRNESTRLGKNDKVRLWSTYRNDECRRDPRWGRMRRRHRSHSYRHRCSHNWCPPPGGRGKEASRDTSHSSARHQPGKSNPSSGGLSGIISTQFKVARAASPTQDWRLVLAERISQVHLIRHYFTQVGSKIGYPGGI